MHPVFGSQRLLKRPDHTVSTFSQHLLSHVERCWDHATSNGLNNLSKFQEQKKCGDVEAKFKCIQTRLNMLSQHLSAFLRGVVKLLQHRFSTNVERMLWPFLGLTCRCYLTANSKFKGLLPSKRDQLSSRLVFPPLPSCTLPLSSLGTCTTQVTYVSYRSAGSLFRL